jgi:hypothetical protein
MSLEFNEAPYCQGENCTNLLTAKVDYDRGLCLLCWEDKETEEVD